MNENLDELIAEFAGLCERISELTQRKRAIADKLAEMAFANRAGGTTVRLTSTMGTRIKVQFRTKVEYDTDHLMTVANLLGSERFEALFKTKLEFTPQKRSLNDFLSTVTSDETTETAKLMIRDAAIETQQSPYVSIERTVEFATEAS